MIEIKQTPIQDAYLIKSKVLEDERGGFSRFFCSKELNSIIDNRKIAQINYSISNTLGTVRGLHFQYPPKMEMKMIRCLSGKVWDVIVDFRRSSKTFLTWHAEVLDPEDNNMMIIPEGCAHGFQTLLPESKLLYLHTEFYSPENEGGIRYNDPTLLINWPLEPTSLSERDLNLPYITNEFSGIM